jgi:hypothetical protein
MGATVFFAGANELATLTNTFSVSGTPTAPSSVTLTVTSPSGTATPYTGGDLTNPSTGVYTKDIPCTEAGVWTYTWIGTGTASDVVAGTWAVTSTAFGELYCTPEQLKSRTGITDNYDDAEIFGACRAVSRWIDGHCDRAFVRRTVTLTLEPANRYCLAVPDLVSVTTLKTDDDGDGVFETTWSASDFQLLPTNAAVEVEPQPYTEIKAVGDRLFPLPSGHGRTDLAQLAVVAGWPALPGPVTEAAAILSGDYLKLGGMAFGVAGYGDYGAVRARMSSPALEMLRAYRRTPILVA